MIAYYSGCNVNLTNSKIRDAVVIDMAFSFDEFKQLHLSNVEMENIQASLNIF